MPSRNLDHYTTLRIRSYWNELCNLAEGFLQNIHTIYQTTQHHIPQENNLDIDCHENLKSYTNYSTTLSGGHKSKMIYLESAVHEG
jgi:hypothetical protein